MRAGLVLENYVGLTPRNGKYTAVLLEARKAFEEVFAAISIRGKANQVRSAGNCRPWLTDQLAGMQRS